MEIRLATMLDVDALESLFHNVQCLHAVAHPALFRDDYPREEARVRGSLQWHSLDQFRRLQHGP